MQPPSASCDVVTAVECAFHFNTRELFFAEAFRALRPGARPRWPTPPQSAGGATAAPHGARLQPGAPSRRNSRSLPNPPTVAIYAKRAEALIPPEGVVLIPVMMYFGWHCSLCKIAFCSGGFRSCWGQLCIALCCSLPDAHNALDDVLASPAKPPDPIKVS